MMGADAPGRLTRGGCFAASRPAAGQRKNSLRAIVRRSPTHAFLPTKLAVIYRFFQ